MPLKPEALEGEEGRLVLSGAGAATQGQKRQRAIDVVSGEQYKYISGLSKGGCRAGSIGWLVGAIVKRRITAGDDR